MGVTGGGELTDGQRVQPPLAQKVPGSLMPKPPHSFESTNTEKRGFSCPRAEGPQTPVAGGLRGLRWWIQEERSSSGAYRAHRRATHRLPLTRSTSRLPTSTRRPRLR